MEENKCLQCGEANKFLHFLFGHKYNKEVSFGWGKFYIIFGFLLGVFTFLSTLSLELLIIYRKLLTVTDLLKYILLIIILPAVPIIMSVGLLQRKKWGLYFFYAINIIGLVLMIFYLNKEVSILELIVALFFTYLWFRYFYKRKDFFN